MLLVFAGDFAVKVLEWFIEFIVKNIDFDLPWDASEDSSTIRINQPRTLRRQQASSSTGSGPNQSSSSASTSVAQAGASTVAALASSSTAVAHSLSITSPSSPVPSSSSSSTAIVSTRPSRKRDDLYNAFVLTLESLKEASDAFAPLKTTAAGLLVLIKLRKDFVRNREDWLDFSLELTEFISLLKQNAPESLDAAVAEPIAKFIKTLGEILSQVQPLLERSPASRGANINIDKEQLTGYRSRIQREQNNLITLLTILTARVFRKDDSVATGPDSMQGVSTIAPPPPIHFYGREDFVANVLEIIRAKCTLNRGAHLCIRGPGGIGKTTIARAVFHDTSSESLFDDRRYFVAAESCLTAQSLLTAIAAVVHADTSGADLLSNVIQTLKSTSSSTLLVIDNAETFWWIPEQRPDVRKVFEHVSTIPHVTLLLTIRGLEQPLGVRWHPVPFVEVLTAASARDAFLAIAPDTESDAQLDSLLKKVDYVPLAITLLASLAQTEDLGTLDARLGHEKASLLQTGFSDHREDNISVSIKLSMDAPPMQMNPLTLRILSLISYLPSGVSRDLLNALLGAQNVSPALQILKQLSLAYAPPSPSPFITTLSPIRLYTIDHHPMASDDIQSLQTWYISLAHKGVSEPGDDDFKSTVGALTPEKANMEFVLGSMIGSPLSDDLTSAILDYSNFLYFTIPDGTLLKKLLPCLLHDDAVQAKCLRTLGNILISLNQYPVAVDYLTQAKEMFEKIGSQLGAAQCLQSLGDMRSMQSQYPEAEDSLTQAKEMFEKVGSQLRAAQCLHSLGDIRRMQSQYPEAEDFLMQAKEMFERIGNQLGVAQCLWSLGEIRRMQDQYSEAEDFILKSKEIREKIGDMYGLAWCLKVLGDIRYGQENNAEAVDYLNKAKEIFERIGDQNGTVRCLQRLDQIRTDS
ncbi:hypothetical protein SISSUDRAFT_1127698 [Sistotremastrum suecicum HHB10207 ss-3]|uniref:ORC1/DEAH AAA+ ATPase domain-containing protein n=1 Tax=Sistotremastrum suecicum HHB10207 ss-3 TaxID=1314776 RepID=A0A166EQW6_9AGAM|nr:hypothetical protein SISSUDRAFT_1127698 [Sistotremastrum suecicum HHB10207 ss-3]